jgi:hypothetical protein
MSRAFRANILILAALFAVNLFGQTLPNGVMKITSIAPSFPPAP